MQHDNDLGVFRGLWNALRLYAAVTLLGGALVAGWLATDAELAAWLR